MACILSNKKLGVVNTAVAASQKSKSDIAFRRTEQCSVRQIRTEHRSVLLTRTGHRFVLTTRTEHRSVLLTRLHGGLHLRHKQFQFRPCLPRQRRPKECRYPDLAGGLSLYPVA